MHIGHITKQKFGKGFVVSNFLIQTMYVGSAANNWLGLVTGLFSLNLCHLIESLIDAGGAQKK